MLGCLLALVGWLLPLSEASLGQESAFKQPSVHALWQQARDCFRRGDYEASGAVPQDSEDMVNYTRSVAGVEVGVFFMEQPRGGVKVSLRARAIDVAKVAEQFGGGGHRLASGTIIEAALPEAKARVLAAVSAAL